VLHSRPLNTISYCADDKTDKGIFTFIAKQPDTNKHSCFVFESEKSVCKNGLRLVYLTYLFLPSIVFYVRIDVAAIICVQMS
jgi:hypothetical protein